MSKVTLETFKEMLPDFEEMPNKGADRDPENVEEVIGSRKGNICALTDSTGTVIYVRKRQDEDSIVQGPEFLFPTAFRERYWESMRLIQRITGLSYEEVRDQQTLPEGFTQQWKHNAPYLEKVGEIYGRMKGGALFLLQRAIREEDLKVARLMDSTVDYIDLTEHGEQVVGGRNLCLRITNSDGLRLGIDQREMDDILKLTGRLKTLTEATADEWRQIETMELVYASGSRTLYKPKFG